MADCTLTMFFLTFNSHCQFYQICVFITIVDAVLLFGTNAYNAYCVAKTAMLKCINCVHVFQNLTFSSLCKVFVLIGIESLTHFDLDENKKRNTAHELHIIKSRPSNEEKIKTLKRFFSLLLLFALH